LGHRLRSTARRRFRPIGDESGFSMVEVLVAILVFSVMIGGIATLQGSTMNVIRNNRHRSVAANLAADEMDTIRSTTFTNLLTQLGAVTQPTVTIDGVPYTVLRETEWVSSDASAGACDAPADADPAFLRIRVAVTWPVMSGVKPVESNTIITPPVGTYDATSGHLAVSVLDRDGAPQEGVPVALAGPESASQITNAEGCVFFAFLTPGSYTATLNKSGWVSDQGVAAPSQNAAIVTGAIASLLFQYDQAASLTLVLSGKGSGSAAPTTVPVMVANSHILPSGILPAFAGSGSPRTITGLFPYADGYEVWTGNCADADPLFHAGGVRDDPIEVTPGGTTTAAVGMPEVLVTVTSASTGLPIAGATISIVHTADAGCTGGVTYTLGTTNAAGQRLFASPYGTWQVRVNGVVKATITLSPTDPAGPLLVAVTA
jgi:prepilin-type N-terminal cleavage/methylation domain-containing protein